MSNDLYARSFRNVFRMVEKFTPGKPSIHITPEASPQITQVGTRSSPSQGTMSSGYTPDPLDGSRPVSGKLGWDHVTQQTPEAYFEVSDEAYDNTEGATVQVKDWPPNPSRSIIAPSVGHTDQLRTDNELQIGEGPGRIARFMPMRIYGVASQSTGQQGGEGFPWNGDMAHIEHIKVPRQALGTKGPQKLHDDNAVVPAIYAGNPR